MRAMEGTSWSRLPEEICEGVLSFLPVPALCKCRAVCKAWNELVRKPSFLDLHDLNGRNRAYLFITRHWIIANLSFVREAYRRTTCVLDLDARRWYSIPVDESLLAPTSANVFRLLAMDEGLVCEYSGMIGTNKGYELVMFDPVAKTRRKLPASTKHGVPVIRDRKGHPPVIVTVVDDSNCSFKVFLMNITSIIANERKGFFVYESSTDAWRSLRNPPLDLGVRVGEMPGRRLLQDSAVFFEGNLYVSLWDYASKRAILLSYNLEKKLWIEVLGFDAYFWKPQLIAFDNRLFVTMWAEGSPPAPTPPFTSSLDYFVLKITELLVAENSNRLVVEIPREDLEKFCGEKDFEIIYGFPLNSNSLMLFSLETGKLLTYDLRSRSISALPAHPLEQGALEIAYQEIFQDFRAKLTKLSLRNIL